MVQRLTLAHLVTTVQAAVSFSASEGILLLLNLVCGLLLIGTHAVQLYSRHHSIVYYYFYLTRLFFFPGLLLPFFIDLFVYFFVRRLDIRAQATDSRPRSIF